MAEGFGTRAMAWWRARRLTDEQYVERIRKKQRSMRKARIVFLCLLAVMVIVTIPNLAKGIHLISKTLVASEMDALLFTVGFVLGSYFGFLVYALFSSIILTFLQERSDKLMLKFYDELKNRELGVVAAEGAGDQ